jgi:DNA-directed RNA polymerase subunit beta
MDVTLNPSREIQTTDPRTGRKSYGRIPEVLPVPHLTYVQRDSFQWFLDEGLKELFAEISPINDFTGKTFELHLLDYSLGPAKYSESECRERDLTYGAPLRVKTRLVAKLSGEIKEQELFVGDLPLMTETGSFIVNGTERVVVSQLVRSPGVYLTLERDATTGRELCYAKLIPSRGAWLEFETSNKGILSVKIDRKRKLPVTTLLRAVAGSSDAALLDAFADVDTGELRFLPETLERDSAKTQNEALLELYRRLRPGDPPTLDNARNLLNSLFFNFRRYDLGRVGRYKLNKRLDLTTPSTQRVLTGDDLLAIVRRMIELNNGQHHPDDIDHLGNRRVRPCGELIQSALRVGLLRLERVVKERMSIQDPESATPAALINIRPVVAALREFFAGSQLSQFMGQTNPLDELTHKRRLSAVGPGGLNRERAGMDVRDVHHSHYGRICPIETNEGPNIGLVLSLATFGRINSYGFIETPYRVVRRDVPNEPDRVVDRVPRQPILNPASGEIVAPAGVPIGRAVARKLAALPLERIEVRPFASDEIRYLTADDEERWLIAQANSQLEPNGDFADELVEVRRGEVFSRESPARIHFLDVSPKQIVSPATSLIPFLEHDEANRALMGANYQRQAVPLLHPQSPTIGTGMEAKVARDSGHVVLARADGIVTSVTAREVVVQTGEGDVERYELRKFARTNQGTCFSQRPIVSAGDRVITGQPLADSLSTQNGELALGQNVLCAFMSWNGYNFEDAIILSEDLVRDDKFTSIHLETHEVEARDTKLGPEEITRDIPNVGDEALRDLDERGIIRVGAIVAPNDLLVGKITPKGETELSAEERLLRAIFGEKAREVKDTSLRVPHGESGKVVDVRVFTRDNHDELPAGVNEMVRVTIAQKRKIAEGDKMSGRHGNKGVVARIAPREDMPFLEDGTPVQIILNPIGVPSRMNVGQILETHLGWAAEALGFKVATPVFDGAREDEIFAELERAGLPREGKARLRDGRTGEFFDQEVTVGIIYMMKLHHLVEDKVHARSTGPYSMITQQPLGGKAQFGGQRLGEMEVWALEAYGAANILQEMLTVKSDDTDGRVKTYEAIVKGEAVVQPGIPESFKVLVKELQSLGLAIEILNEDEEQVALAPVDSDSSLLPELGINLSQPELGD